MPADDLQSTYLRLRPDCSIERLPVDAQFWPRLIGGELGDFHHEYLVTSHACDADWTNWEMHPNGDEIVALLSGAAAAGWNCGTAVGSVAGSSSMVMTGAPSRSVL